MKTIKVLKTIGIVAAIGLAVWYFDSKSTKRAYIREDTYYSLVYFSEELDSIIDEAQEARWSESYYSMEEALSSIEERCEDLRKRVDDIAEKSRPSEPDDREFNFVTMRHE